MQCTVLQWHTSPQIQMFSSINNYLLSELPLLNLYLVAKTPLFFNVLNVCTCIWNLLLNNRLSKKELKTPSNKQPKPKTNFEFLLASSLLIMTTVSMRNQTRLFLNRNLWQKLTHLCKRTCFSTVLSVSKPSMMRCFLPITILQGEKVKPIDIPSTNRLEQS